MRAFIFPGQGSQSVGMGAALADASPAAREVFGEVDEALGQHLTRLMREGPEDMLTLTENAQPAIMACSLAALAMLTKDGGVALTEKADYVAGHSLGEYSALCAARSFALGTTARLLKRRGQAMQAAVPVGEGAMAVLLGLDFATAARVAADAAEGEVCQIANDNGGGQQVVSGTVAAVERAIVLGKEAGAKRAMRLAVSAPFHCALMQPAAEAMAAALAETPPIGPVVPLFANVTAAPVADAEEIRALLVAQVTGMVRWRETIEHMAAAGVTEVVEFGGKVLAPMVKRIAPDMAARSLVTPADIEALVAEW